MPMTNASTGTSSEALPATGKQGRVTVSLAPHPFAVERIQARMPAGGTVAGILAGFAGDAAALPHAHAYIDGAYIPRDKWHAVRPKAGTVLTLRVVPMGSGGGKNPLRTVLSLALIAASPMIAAGIAGALGVTAGAAFMGISAARIITAGVNLLGRLALNALAPPGKPRFGMGLQESPTLFIQGARNQAYPFARVPKVLGRHRFVPPLGAMPYTETAGNDQYIRMIFVWGYGPLHISDIKIGETPIEQFDGVDIETRQGYPDDPPLTLYSNSVMQTDMNITLRQADGYVIRTTETDADEISVDITLPRGLVVFGGNGSKRATEVQLEVQYSPVGADAWSAPATSYKPIAAKNLTLPARPGGYQKPGHINTMQRYDRIFLDTASGAVSFVSGPVKRLGHDGEAPALPSVPSGKVPLARILRQSSDGVHIPPAAVTSERGPDIVAAHFEAETDFAVTTVSGNNIGIAAGGLKYPGVYLAAKQTSALRHAVAFKVPRGRYDVRVRRITADADDDNTFNDTVWTALRTVRNSYPIRMQNLAVTALRIKATDQMNGIVDRLNGVVHSILPDWNGENWVEQATSNPASLYRHVLQGSANARPLNDARLDLPRLQAWHAACATTGREFNAVIDYDVSVREVLHDIAAAGRASPTILDGKWSVIEDRPQSVPIQHFTPYNTYGFQGRKAFDEVPEALRIRFINREKGWLQDERLVFRDGFDEATATKYESLTLTGITDPAQAWRDGRYHLATALLRPETYSFYCDIEHLVCTRGDLIRFTHDVPLFGLHGSRVAAVVADPADESIVLGIRMESAMPMAAGESYAARFRHADGSSSVVPLRTQEGTHDTVTFAVPQPLTAAPEPGDLLLAGIAGRESVALVVQAIEPQSDLGARITCVDAAPAIHAADQGSIPLYNSRMTLPAELQRPPRPQLTRIQAGADTAIRHADGSVTSQTILHLAAPAYTGGLNVRAQARAIGESFYHDVTLLSATPARVAITGLDPADIYDLRLRYVTSAGMFSEPLVIAGYSAADGTMPPPDVTSLNVYTVGHTSYLVWQMAQMEGITGFKLRFAAETHDANWQNAADIGGALPADARSTAQPARVGTYLLKAIGANGRESLQAVTAVTDIAAVSGYNAVLTVNEGPAFDGATNDVVLADDTLQLAAGHVEGQYYFAEEIDLGQIYTSLVTAHVAATGLDRAESLDIWPDFDRIDNIDNNSAPGLWDVQLQIRTTTDPRFIPAVQALTQESAFDHADWTKTRCGITANAATAPDESNAADKIVEDAAAGTHIVSQPTTAVDNAPAAFGLFVKAGERGFAGIYLSTGATDLDDAIGATIDLSSGATSYLYTYGTATGITVAAQDMGGGWWRFAVSGTVKPEGSGDAVYAQIRLADASGSTVYTGDGSSGLYVWGAHVTQTSLPYRPVWSDWRDFTLGEYTARGFMFRAQLRSRMATVTPVVSDISVTVDMPDRTESGKDIDPDAAGSTVGFAKAFRDTPALTVTPQDMATGDYYTITGITPTGFHIRFFNSGGGGISRRFDYVAKGFGERA